MKRIAIEKIIVYILGFMFCFFISLNQGKSSSNAEQEFLNNVSSIMKKYNYVETECPTDDLEYIQNDNSIILSYIKYPKEVQLSTIHAEFNLNYGSDLNSIYSLLSELYDENISIYSNEIQKMIRDYTTTGEEQMWDDLNSNRQLLLGIKNTTSIGKDYKFYYSITAFTH